jgi:hypothetical protein
MKGQCGICRNIQASGNSEYCCLRCRLRYIGLADYLTTDEDSGILVLDLTQKILDGHEIRSQKTEADNGGNKKDGPMV